MNCYLLDKLLNDVDIEYYFNEIFYDENDDEIVIVEFENDDVDVDDDVDIKFEYLLKHYVYDYELIIDVDDVDDVDELKNKILSIDDEIEIYYESNIELIYRNK